VHKADAKIKWIKSAYFSLANLAIASYYLRFPPQLNCFFLISLLSPLYAKVSYSFIKHYRFRGILTLLPALIPLMALAVTLKSILLVNYVDDYVDDYVDSHVGT
jgi:hypothetical protein